MIGRSKPYAITPKGRTVLHGPTAWGLSRHLRDVLALCDPQATLDQLQQFMPRESLRAAVFALRDLGLVEGPAIEAPMVAQLAGLRPEIRRARSPAVPA